MKPSGGSGSSTARCAKCGEPLEAAHALCIHCGEPVPGNDAEQLLGQKLLGTYEVTSLLGQGGMSLVYRGRHVMTEQAVAIKVLPPELAVHVALKQRFLEEARALAKLEHPNIVRLYNFGEDHGRLCLVMQLVEGDTFERQIIKHGQVEPAEAIRVTIEVLKALEYAHAAGIVHRDIKPSNVLIRPGAQGEVYVMDFGIARVVQTSQRLTETGQTMGTVRYMSPEQVRGQVVDQRSDLYSLGITLYEGLVGETPFEGETHFEVMSKHLQEAPRPPSEHGVKLAPAVEAVLLRSLKKDPAARYQDARDMRLAFEAALRGAGRAAEENPTQPSPALDRPIAADPIPAAPAMEPTTPGRRRPVAPPTTVDSPSEPGLASALEPDLSTGLSSPTLRRGKRRGPALFIGVALAVVAGGVGGLLAMRSQSKGKGKAATPDAALVGGASPSPSKRPGRPTGRVAPHPVALSRKVATDVTLETPAPLRVIAGIKVDPAALAADLAHTQQQLGKYLAELSRPETLRAVPLTLALVPTRTLSQQALFPDFDIDPSRTYESRYIPESATLFVAEDANLDDELAYGFALHLCYQSWPTELRAIKECAGLAQGYSEQATKH